ncbi:MAG: LacI family DNA-binding transcriptional regulator [Aureliella sp.]
MKEVTIQDIANEAKVSKSTVSRVLNGTTAVHPDKKEAVLAASRRLGFKPNFFAQSLAKGRSMTIGVQTQLMGSPFYDTISQGIISEMRGSGYSPIFVDGQWTAESEEEGIQALIGRRVDGLILICGAISAERIREICGQLPTVIVARELPAEHHNCIYVDNVDAGYRATQHLVYFGHREIAMVQGLAHHPDAIDRLEGYKKALAENDIPFDPELIVEGTFLPESGEAAVDQLLANNKKFSAVFASNDMMAFGVRLALHKRGLRVPEDVSIVGFDDQAESAFTTPPLTTVRQPAIEMGRLAAQSVLELIDGKTFEPRAMQAQLQARESVARIQP